MTAVDSATASPDLGGLEAIRRRARTAPDVAAQGVAQQFEALLIQMMLKSMRQALPTGGGLGGAEAAFDHDLLDAQLALTISRRGGLGLADRLEGQLSASLPRTASAAAAAAASTSGPLRAIGGAVSERTSADGTSAPAPAVASGPRPANRTAPATPPVPQPAAARAFASPADFVAGLWDAAQASATQLGVSPELLIAQAAHETGWGRSIPHLPDGRSSHNLFGIKTGSRWPGPRVVQSTLEVVDGVAVREQAAFRAYDSFEDAFVDYAALVSTSPRYRVALAQTASPQDYLRSLQASGYATDPHYADRVLALLAGPTLRLSLAALKGAGP